MRIGWNRYRLFASALLALSLAGCEPSQPLNAHQGQPPQATAPALPTPPSQAATPPPLTPQQQHVRQLIQQVEDAYAQGLSLIHISPKPQNPCIIGIKGNVLVNSVSD